MPAIRVADQVGANASNPNILVGSAFEFAGTRMEVEVAITKTTAQGDLVADVQFGPDVQIEAAPVSVEPSAGGGPRIPDNIIISGIAAPGDRLKVALRETAGVATDFVAQVFTRPLL